AFTKHAIVYPQEIRAGAVRGARFAEVGMIFFAQFTAGMQPNLVQHPGEIHHPLGHFLRAFRVCAHLANTRASLRDGFYKYFRFNVSNTLSRGKVPFLSSPAASTIEFQKCTATPSPTGRFSS